MTTVFGSTHPMRISMAAFLGLLLLWSISTLAQSTAISTKTEASTAQVSPSTAPTPEAAQQEVTTQASDPKTDTEELALESDPEELALESDPEELALESESDPARKFKNVAKYKRLLEEQQLHYGAYEESLAEIYAGLGTSLQSLDQHEQAIDALSQAIHIQRVNGGLYNLEGAPLIEKLIESYIASGDWEAIDNRFHFLLQLHARNYDPFDPRLLPALDKAIRWHMYAFNENYGEEPLKHILTARDLLHTSARILEFNFGSSDLRLTHQLNGAAVADYYVAMYQAENGYADTLVSRTNDEKSIFSEEISSKEVMISSFAAGKRALQHLVELNANSPDTPIEGKALAIIKLADWHLLFRKSRTAQKYYQQAFEILKENESLQAMLTEQFGNPVLLPQTDDLDLTFPVPKIKNQQKGFVLLSFDVTHTGKARNVDVLETSPDHNSRRILDAKRTLKSSQFRPQIADGEPVSTKGMRYRYTYNYIKKNEPE